MPFKDRQVYLEYQRRYRKSHKQKKQVYHHAYNKERYLKHRDKILDSQKRYQKRYRKSLRNQIFKLYGGQCECCGEATQEFLSIDHINGGGSKHRKESNTYGTGIYRAILKEGYRPDRYRILCYNCNLSIGFNGYCPHQKKG